MKKIQEVRRTEKVQGKVLELCECEQAFVLKRYGKNIYDTYECIETIQTLSIYSEAGKDILTRKSFDARAKRLRYYFNEAEYISEEVIHLLQKANILNS